MKSCIWRPKENRLFLKYQHKPYPLISTHIIGKSSFHCTIPLWLDLIKLTVLRLVNIFFRVILVLSPPPPPPPFFSFFLERGMVKQNAKRNVCVCARARGVCVCVLICSATVYTWQCDRISIYLFIQCVHTSSWRRNRVDELIDEKRFSNFRTASLSLPKTMWIYSSVTLGVVT